MFSTREHSTLVLSLAMSSEGSRLRVPSRRKERYIAVTCPYVDCKVLVEYQPPSVEAVKSVPASVTTFSVTCCACHRNFDPPAAPKTLREVRAQIKGSGETSKRRIGTDEHPLDMTLYVSRAVLLTQLRPSGRPVECVKCRHKEGLS